MLTRRTMLGQVGAAASAAWAMRAGVAVGAGGRTAVDFDIPRGACDCHVHVFGDPATFPFAEKRIYTPPQASIEQQPVADRGGSFVVRCVVGIGNDARCDSRPGDIQAAAMHRHHADGQGAFHGFGIEL